MELPFGHQLQYAASVVEAHQRPLDFGPADGGERAALAQQYSKVVMQIVVSVALLAFCMVVLLRSGTGDPLQKAAIGFIGTVVGYWLR